MRQRIKDTIAEFKRLLVEALLRALANDLATAIVTFIKGLF